MPENLAVLAEEILDRYDFRPEAIRVIQTGGIKTVWKIKTGAGLYCLKRLRQEAEKSLFSIAAQSYMSKRGARVPGIVPAKSGAKFIEHKGRIFVLYDWLEGRHLSFKYDADLRLAVRGLAEFHLGSAGYQAPPGIRVSSKLGRWPHQYSSMHGRLIRWKEIAAGRPQKNLCRVYLAEADFFIDLAGKVLELLASSPYRAWVKQVEAQKLLCHQDYGEGNALLTGRGLYVLDLDGVTYELPARDLRKLILKTMSRCKHWDETRLEQILSWYEEINPLTVPQRQVLYLDLLFPHEFHNTAKNPFHKHKEIGSRDLAAAARLGREKIDILTKRLREQEVR